MLPFLGQAHNFALSVDSGVVDYLHTLTAMVSGAVIKFGVVIIMSPVFGLPGALLCVVGGWLGQLFVRTQRAVKRERSNARSPILAHIGAAITGLGGVSP